MPVSGLLASSARDDGGAAVNRRIINGEPCELVAYFAQLGEGMIVYAGPCPCHRRMHRSMLMGKETLDLNAGLGSPGGISECFPMAPPPEGNDKIRITPGFVAAGQVWRVVDETPLYQRTVRARVKVKT